MSKGFVMIDVEPGCEKSVEATVRKIAGVELLYPVTGEHDLIAFIDTEPYANFAHLISSIRQAEGVKDTETLLVLEAEGA